MNEVLLGELLGSKGVTYGVVKPGDHTPHGIPLIKAADVGNGRVNSAPNFRICQEKHQEHSRTELNGGELLITLVGTPGQCAIAPPEVKGFNVVRAVGVFNTEPIADGRFIMYSIQAPQSQAYLRNVCNTTVQATLNLGDLKGLPLSIPDIKEQKAIAHILGTLDDKIELNRKTNETLEAMAKALFKSWFVDFDPVRAKAEGRPTGLPPEISDLFPDSFEDSELGEIPTGWHHRDLQEVGSVIDPHPSHRAPQEISEGFPFAGIGDIDEMGNINRSKARVVGEESVTEQENSYEVNEHSNGFGRVGTVGKVVRLRRLSFRFALSPTLAIVNPTNPCYAGLCFLLLRSPGFQSKVLSNMTGSTRPAIGIQILRKVSTLLPPEDARAIYEHFESLTGGLIRKGDALNARICLLTEARDALLPKLISGEIRIPDAEKMLEEVGI
jgi:type I restriction enzyme S subunit